MIGTLTVKVPNNDFIYQSTGLYLLSSHPVGDEKK